MPMERAADLHAVLADDGCCPHLHNGIARCQLQNLNLVVGRCLSQCHVFLLGWTVHGRTALNGDSAESFPCSGGAC
jgi:hypothetical protein